VCDFLETSQQRRQQLQAEKPDYWSRLTFFLAEMAIVTTH
jgi:hypothetical protein